ncbi:hypothetical protein MKP09_13070 [Niabella ginsengisoli]|uniref:Uncharacterized protein n=1 Tax=Niabella ginsengisoli TaxID=522298 RepID=A0ABS9SK93_9BACT|nr:hypothetical protein [Niabella ginsengisoli]MCH5598770.1 hypothetical protein [Niabella ginsengisoli]
MKKYTFILLSLICTVFSSVAQVIRIANPRCEYIHNPLGVEVLQPELSWEIQAFEKKSYSQLTVLWLPMIAFC